MTEVTEIFVCERCGNCCQGETTVSLDINDQKRMFLSLQMSETEVHRKFLRVTGNVVQMKTVDGHCIFYKDGCNVHNGRPWRCAQWPLHPSILSDENNFKTISQSCPGIKKQIGYRKFCETLRALMKNGTVKC